MSFRDSAKSPGGGLCRSSKGSSLFAHRLRLDTAEARTLRRHIKMQSHHQEPKETGSHSSAFNGLGDLSDPVAAISEPESGGPAGQLPELAPQV